ncbi:MAG: DNA recombination protein RmuC [Bacteroidota bacterium]|nr:DNA recombination protein RmuC [Bacteroidota bacterium]
MESSQLITILILILALLTAGILLLARQLARRGSDSIAADPEAERVRFDRDQLQAELERTREELSGTRQELQAAIEARSKAEQRYEDHAQEAENRRTELKREFDLLARDIIQKNAERHQKHLSEGGKETLSAVVKPIQEKFIELQNQMNKFYGDEREQLGQLDKELEKLFSLNQSLQAEAKHLTNALKGESKVQGDWGEYQLERILEQVGLVEGIHYSKQSSQRDEAGKLYRPDFLIYLPDDKVLIIDSKVSLTAYERMTQADDPTIIEQERTAHAASVSAHIKGLGKKNYAELYGKSTDYTLMFMPVEASWVALDQHLLRLQEEALGQNVLLVSTSTLIATLRTISYVWQQEEQKANIQKIAERGSKLYHQIYAFLDEFSKIRTQLTRAQSSYDDALVKLKGRQGALYQAEQMRELGVNVKARIPEEFTADLPAAPLELPEEPTESEQT